MQTRPWDFMVKDTPSRDWAEGMGKLIAVAFFCGGIAGGLYLVSLYFNNLWGMLIGWLFALGMGLFDMAHLGKKKIVWRIALRPGSSWISRGFLLVILFIGSAAIQMALTRWAPGTTAETFFKIIAGIAALGVATYSGFVLSYVNCIKIWNSTVMPVLFIIAGFAGGSAILLVVTSLSDHAVFSTVKVFAMAVLLVYAVIIALHLWISSYNGPTSRNSVKAIVQNGLAAAFWTIVVFIGIVVPLAIIPLADAGSSYLLGLNAVFVLAGNLTLRYAILRAGMYRPLIPCN
ncbi:MAG: polysulfide reductase NrfD [Dehalococcoidales bacterium]|nr:polysulfide reductase NrfD [Dehalococcoidales bacterium]